jgi:biotin transport system substrate-specific component
VNLTPGSAGAAGLPITQVTTGTRAMAVSIAVAVMAASAQMAVPLPFTPVPATLQPVAVLAIGALLGSRLGVAALVTYLIVGAAGLPVFAMGGAGIARLIGPTGGYLLAFPVAAAVAGLGGRGQLRTMIPSMIAAMVVIHAGGAAWLAILGNDPRFAFEAGFLPFLTGDLFKIALAVVLVLLLAPRFRLTR